MSVISTLRYIGRHPLASRQPLSAYWRYGCWQIESRLRGEVAVDWVGGSKLIASNGMTGATGNIYCGLHEFADMAFLMHLLRASDLFVDVGANVGSYAVLASAVCGARTIAIEPDPVTSTHLHRNIAANAIGSLVAVAETAVGEGSGKVWFTVGRDTTNQVVARASANTEAREVDVQPLDELLAAHQPVLIKIDVEGYEAKVIAGAPRTLAKAGLQAVLIETVDDEILASFHAMGFRRASYEPFQRHLDWAEVGYSSTDTGNTLFVRDLDFCRHRIASAVVRNVFGQQV